MKLKIFFAFLLITQMSISQELNCKVTIERRQIQKTDNAVFTTLQSSISEFMNGRQWTTDQFASNEKIECTILLNLTEMKNNNQFRGTMSISSRRPVYNSGYNTQMLNFVDNNIAFVYNEFDPLDFSETTFSNNLTSILAYYAYIIIGLDYDSFSLYGGTPWFQKSELIVSNAQNAPEGGWKSSDKSLNRFWLVSQLQNAEYRPVREFIYQYHINGLDKMHENSTEARKSMITGLKSLQQVHQRQPSSFAMRVLFDAISDEIIMIFKPAPATEKSEANTILSQIDVGRLPKYQEMMK